MKEYATRATGAQYVQAAAAFREEISRIAADFDGLPEGAAFWRMREQLTQLPLSRDAMATGVAYLATAARRPAVRPPTTIRSLITRARAAGWTHSVYGIDEGREHVWRRGPAQVSVWRNVVELSPDVWERDSVRITKSWDKPFDLDRVARIAEDLSFLPIADFGSGDPEG